jgi:DNA-binding SARP family transcriptional activator
MSDADSFLAPDLATSSPAPSPEEPFAERPTVERPTVKGGIVEGLIVEGLIVEGLIREGLAAWERNDWDAAFAHFDQAAGDALPPAAVWRFGALLYLRGEGTRAVAVLAAAAGAGPDHALVLGWLASALWSRGDVDAAADAAEASLEETRQSRDLRAIAAAQVALALVAASRGDRDANDDAYRAALAAASQVGDDLQSARIHANLSSRACEQGDFERAVVHADRSLTFEAAFPLLGGLALTNKAEALAGLGRLDEARECAVEASEAFEASGSRLADAPQLLLGELYRQRGDAIQARLWTERAARVAERVADAHVLVQAWTALAWILASDEPEAASAYACQAVDQASSLERSAALAASAWVKLCAGNGAEAARLATRAEAEARRTDDRPRLATALELRAVAAEPADPKLLDAAERVWREVADPISAARCAVSAALCRGASSAAAADELVARGAVVELGVTAWLAERARDAQTPSVTTLGRFVVTAGGTPVPASAWQSRKARDLLKLLITRGGRPVTRDAVAEALWPDEDPTALANRFAVALHTVRRVLDPAKSHPADHFVEADTRALSLRTDRVRVDLEDFMLAAGAGDQHARSGDLSSAHVALDRAAQLYRGDFLEDDLFAEWSCECRERARSAIVSVERLRARMAGQHGDFESVSAHLRRLLERDPYDEDAWMALVAAEHRLRRHGEARAAFARYQRRMADLDLTAADYEQACRRDW